VAPLAGAPRRPRRRRGCAAERGAATRGSAARHGAPRRPLPGLAAALRRCAVAVALRRCAAPAALCGRLDRAWPAPTLERALFPRSRLAL
jgi:hypothetical protein